MKKKILSITLALVMVLAIAPVSVFAEDDILNYLTYEITDGEVTITGCDKSISGDIVIPDTIEGYPVVALGWQSFMHCSNITSVIIPDSVITMDNSVFESCTLLESIKLSEYLTDISYCSFNNCDSLTTITIPANVEEIRQWAFAGCDNLETVIMNGGVIIQEGAFLACEKLTKVTIADSVTEIYPYAFANCNSLKQVIIPKNVTKIYTKAFCSSYDGMYTVEEFIIYGYTGTAAETYANKNGITFVAIEESIPELVIKDNSNITITDTIVNLTPQMTVADIVKSVENENVQILNKDGEVITADALVGTGSKVQVLDKDGNVLSEYDVVIKADVNGDATITAADARLTLRASASLDKIEGVYKLAANYNGDSDITAADARMILRKSAGLE